MDLYRSRSSRHRSDEKRDRDRDEDEDGRRSKRLRSHHRSRSRDRERDRHRSSREHRDKEGDRDREKSRDKEERNGKDREREKDKDRESKGRDHEKDPERDRSRRSRSRSERHRSQEREKSQEIEPKERETKDRDRRLYVGNLHANISEDDLRKVFEAFGTVELVQVPRDETGLCKGFGFVQFARLEDARNVLNRNGQLEIAGHAIKVSAVTDQTEVPEAGQQQNTGGLSEEELAKEAALYVTRAQDSNQKLQKAALENFRKRIPESNSPIHTFPETLEFLRPHYANLQDILKEMDDSRNHLSDILTVLKLTGEKASYLDIVDWPEVGGKSVYELRMNELKAELRNHKLGEKGNRSEMQLRLALHIRKKENKYFRELRGKPIHELTDLDLKSELRLRLLRVTGSSDELVMRLAKAVNHGIQISEDEKSLVPSTWEDREEVKGVDYPIAFLDLEFKRGTILEVGIVLVDPKTWNCRAFSAIIRQSEKFMKSYVGRPSFPRNMLEHDYKDSPMFSDVHEIIFYCLNGRTIIGHNIESCDMPLIRDRCFDLGLSVPVPKEIIDTYKWMEEKTDRKLYPNLKLADLASQFELREQTHRAQEDCFLNIEVFKRVLASQNLLEIIETEKSDNTPKRNRRRLK